MKMIKEWVKEFGVRKALMTVLAVSVSFSYVVTINKTYQTNNYVRQLSEKDNNIAVVILEVDSEGNLVAIHPLTVEQADSIKVKGDTKNMIAIPIYPGKTIKIDAPTKKRRRR
jgi:hypothetical protein